MTPFETASDTMRERLREREEIRLARLLRRGKDRKDMANEIAAVHDGESVSRALDLKHTFLSRLGLELERARERAGLSRREVAGRAGITEDAIREVAQGSVGRLTIEQLVDVALACQVMPLDVTLEAEPDVLEFVEESRDRPHTSAAFDRWLARRSIRRVLAEADRSSSRPDVARGIASRGDAP